MSTVNLYERRHMMPFVENLKKPRTFLVNKFFKRVVESAEKYLDFDVILGSRRIAPYVTRGGEGSNVMRQGYETKQYQPPMLIPILPLSEQDASKRQPGQFIYSSSGPDQQAALSVANDLAKLEELIQRNEEVQAAEALLDGKVTAKDIEGNKLAEVNFGRKSNHTITLSGSGLWTHADSDPLSDLRKWRKLCVQDDGLAPRAVIMGGNVLDAFLNHAKVQAKLNLRRGDMNEAIERQEIGGATYEGKIQGFEIWTYDEWYIQNGASSESALIGDNYLLMACEEANYVRAYGGIFDEETGAMYAAQRLPDSWTEKNPKGRFVKLESAPLMIPTRPNTTVKVKAA